AQSLEEQDELELEEDHGVNGRPASISVAVLHPRPDEREVERGVEETIEVIRRNQLLKRDRHRLIKQAQLRWTQHRKPSCRFLRPVQSTDAGWLAHASSFSTRWPVWWTCGTAPLAALGPAWSLMPLSVPQLTPHKPTASTSCE